MRHLLIAAHLLIAIVLLAMLCRQLGNRAQEVANIRGIAHTEHVETERMAAEIELHQSLLNGIRTKDPYVIEMLARDRLGYQRAGEYAPPPITSGR